MRVLRLVLLLAILGGGAWVWYTYMREPDWRALALKDVEHIYVTLRDSHPGTVDPDNPGFRDLLESAYADARGRAEKVETAAGHFYAKRAMTVAFQDAHLVDGLYALPKRELRWPGFLVGPDAEDGLSVIHGEVEGAPPLGARLLSCDGMSVDQLIEERVKPYVYNSWLSSKRAGDDYLILIDLDNPFLPGLTSCRFSVEGVEQGFALNWQPMDDDKDRALRRMLEPVGEERTDLRTLDDGTVWISIGSFADFYSDGRQVIDALVEDIKSNRDAIAAAPALVIDVRENKGGATAVGLEIAGAIWGDGYIQDRAPRHSATDWRASDYNLGETRKILSRLEATIGKESDLYKRIFEIGTGLERALEAGEDYFSQKIDQPDHTGEDPQSVPSSVYFLTDHNCVSACLDFADLMVLLPNVVHIGQETAGDTAYLEVITSVLPSKAGQLSFPAAVHRGRARGNNQTYMPVHLWEGNITDTAALETWVKALTAVDGAVEE